MPQVIAKHLLSMPKWSKLNPIMQASAQIGEMLKIDQSISKKISFGYTLALGTAIGGTSCGLLGSYFYARPAQIQAEQMQHRKQLLSDFNNHLLSIQTHPLRLLAISGENQIWVQYETNQFTTEIRQTNRLLDEIEQVVPNSQELNTQLTTLVSDYRVTLLAYEDFTHDLWENLDSINSNQSAPEMMATALKSPRASELSTAFEKLSEDLTRLQQAVDQNYRQATQQLQHAERLRLIIIIGSMATSIGLAVVLAAITSRAIAKPIEQLTVVARQVTQDNDFQLQATIQTRDEVALLAQALNQLVSWAGQYTAELEDARQTLENRVEERTQALQQSETSLRLKAEDLQRTLNELQHTQLQLIQSEKMSSLGQMVAGIAHEINNPINFIHGNLQHAIDYTEKVLQLLNLYQSHYPQPNSEIQAAIDESDLLFLQADFPKLIRSMEDGTTRIRDIIKSLRTFSRLDEAAIKQVDICDGIESTLNILSHSLKEQSGNPAIHVIRDYGKLPLIECYAGQMNQVFMNVLSNAIDALRVQPAVSEPTITIKTRVFDHHWITIHIADNGPGISEEVQKRLFDPFFTTKPVGKGTGLGLSISYQIVTETHQGQLECQSTLGQGTEFTIKLPIHPPQLSF